MREIAAKAVLAELPGFLWDSQIYEALLVQV